MSNLYLQKFTLIYFSKHFKFKKMIKSVQNMQASLCYNATDYLIMKLCYYYLKINSHYRIVTSFDKQVKQDMLEFCLE